MYTHKHQKDLRKIQPENDGNYSQISMADMDGVSAVAGVVVHSENLAAALAKYIEEADAVFGCAAWFTNRQVLTSMAGKTGCVIVQKEDFLRPDHHMFKQHLRNMYESISGFDRYDTEHTGVISSSSDSETDGVRCVGMAGSKGEITPRMHHKFFVFCRTVSLDLADDDYSLPYQIHKPYAVWTGSYNPTENAERSLENAVYIANPVIADSYLQMFAYTLALSEPLDWDHTWVEPEYRIGT